MILFLIICVIVLSSLTYRRPMYGYGWFNRPMFFRSRRHYGPRPMGPRPMGPRSFGGGPRMGHGPMGHGPMGGPRR